MNALFMDDLGHSKELTLEAFRRRSWGQRLKERAARLITRLL